jgi:hypothetical protein
MPRQPPPKRDNPEQSQRFIDMAREVGVDESPNAFDRAFGQVVRSKAISVPTRKPSKHQDRER